MWAFVRWEDPGINRVIIFYRFWKDGYGFAWGAGAHFGPLWYDQDCASGDWKGSGQAGML